MTYDKDLLLGKRIAAIDYGEARIGVAVCDERHIVVSTRPVITNDEKVWEALASRMDTDRIDVVLVGVPRRLDDSSSDIIKHIEQFILELRRRIFLPVFEVDESFSTMKARELMLSVGVKKKRRSAKGTKDAMAAAVILSDVLEELG
ncbi:MAG: Holliday junction resolvase RuvX [Ignavibacteria bacterium]|nr:Holliday junction resolvase RuvX [Ignavibacteria bacterium]